MLANLRDRWAYLVSFIPAALRWRMARISNRIFRLVFRVTAVLGLLAFIGFLALYIKLSFAPVSMSSLVAPIEKAVNGTLSGMHFDIGDAVLRTSEGGLGIELRLTKVSLIDDDGDRIVESPFATAGVSLRGLLQGRLAAGNVELIEPQIFLQYSEDKGLALSFGDPRASKTDLGGSPAAAATREDKAFRAPPAVNEAAAPAPAPVISPHAKVRALNLTKAFHNIFAATRRGESAFLTTIGIRNATVYFDRSNEVTTWRVPSLDIDLEHAGKDSAVHGEVAVDTPAGQWQMQFHVHQNRRSQRLNLSLSVDDVIPNAIANEFPSLYLPKILNLPVSISAELELAGLGDIMSADLQAKFKKGEVYAPWDQKHPARIDKGNFRVTYSREEGKITVQPSELRWGDSRIKLSGGMARQPTSGRWAFQLATDEIVLGAEEFGIPAIPLDRVLAQGDYDPRQGAITLDRFFLQAADAQISLAGAVTRGANSPAIQFKGQISRMPVAFLKLIWPVFVANGAREWIGERVPSGRIAGGTVKIDIPADLLAATNSGANIPQNAVDFRLDLEDLAVRYYKQLPPLHTSRATASISGQRFFFVAPEGEIVVPSGDRIVVTDGKFIIGDLRPRVPDGEIHFKTQSSPNAVLELLDHEPLHYIRELNTKVPTINGTSTGTFSIALPLLKGVRFKDLKVNGRSHVENIRATGLPGGFGVHEGKLDFDLSEKAIEAHGDIKMNGMPVAVNWQRIFDAAPDQQPPLRLRAVLNEAAREELGLPINHIVRGSIATELMLMPRPDGAPLIRFEANLTDADLVVSSMGWRKPPGLRTLLTFDVESQDSGGIRLKDMNLSGDAISVHGDLMLDEQRKPVSFAFPKVALNQQTDFEMKGQLDSSNLWDIRVTGNAYDGRQFFRSLFSAGQLTEDQPQPPSDTTDIDVKIDIENVTGFFDTSASKVSVKVQRRKGKVVFLDLHGRLNKDGFMAARIEEKNGGPRMLLAESTDAGAAFRLIGFYPSARGGELTLEVNLDGSGVAEKEGMLFARNFAVLNDQVMGEVVSGSKKGQRPQQNQTQQVQYAERLDFDSMRIPFSVGYGQFVLHEGSLAGPAMGVTLRGKIDFKNERMNLSGTYTPAYALNNMISVVPILGDILTGRDGEGMFALSFTVQGSMNKPDVQVNPLSPLAPGAVRQIMEDTSVPRITPPEKRAPAKPGTDARASSQPPATR